MRSKHPKGHHGYHMVDTNTHLDATEPEQTQPVPAVNQYGDLTDTNQPKTKRFKPSKRNIPWNNPGFVGFILLFALIGSYFIFKSFAATGNVGTLEAESMTGSGQVISDGAASGSKALKFTNSTVASGNITASDTMTALTIRARGDQCVGTPLVSISIDGKKVLTAGVSSTNWTTYPATLVTSLPAGSHAVTAQFTNPNTTSSCSRVLYLDIITGFKNTPSSKRPDSTKPTIALTTPTNGATITGTVNVSANASDNIGVAKVDFFVDNNLISTIPSGSSYTYALDTTNLSNASHIISATAYDGAGNTNSNSVGVTVSNTSNNSNFITRSGQQLLLNGQPFRMLGYNVWRFNVSYRLPNTGYLLDAPSTTTLSDSLTSMLSVAPKINTVRGWFFEQEVTPTTSGYNWASFDQSLQVAQSKGLKVIATLADQWSYEGPAFKDYNWYNTGYKTQTFSGSASGVAYNENVPYRQYVQDVVSRYKNNPTIAAWELVNEAENFNDSTETTCQSNAATVMANFASDVGGLIKSIDSNHLVSLGMAGSGSCGTNGSDYQTVVAVPQLDLCSFHDYEGATNASAFNSGNGLNTRIPQCAAVNKPIYIGEVGINYWDSAVNGTLTTRASLLNNKLSAQLGMQGVVGFIPWEWNSQVPPMSSCCSKDYRYGINDPALTVINQYGL